jgi:hypothetical protein
LRNWAEDAVALAGWKLESVDGSRRTVLDALQFTARLSISAGGTVVVHSGQASSGRIDEGTGPDVLGQSLG